MKLRFNIAMSVMLLVSAPLMAGGDPMKGKEKAAVCAGCHGQDGNSTIGANPRLAGQYESYLYQALLQYKNNERQNPLMQGMVANLTEDDLKDLAAWFSSQGAGNQLLVMPEK